VSSAIAGESTDNIDLTLCGENKEDGMATRAERFRSTTARQGQEGAGSGGAKKNGSRKPSPAKRAKQLGSPAERRYGGPSTALRNLSLGKKAVYALEDSEAPQRPSRKSSRGGKNRSKAATPLTSRQTLRVTSPANRHDRGR
jgi:hypothetical protein